MPGVSTAQLAYSSVPLSVGTRERRALQKATCLLDYFSEITGYSVRPFYGLAK
jgi:hypothetical protein